MRQAGEPSVEEILASIKKVIARDSRDAGAARTAPARDADVLDLGAIAAQVVGAPRDAAETEAAPPLVADDSAQAMRESLAALALLAEPGARPQIVRSGETSLEGLVRDMLRPMLAQWLDTHLPPMVERLVAAEIARIAHKRG